MTIQGVRLSSGFITDARPKNWREGVLRLFPNGKAPLFALTAGIPSKMTDDPEYHWWEKGMEDYRVAITVNLTAGATTITVAATAGVNNALIAGIKAGHIIRIEESGELVYVSADPLTGGTTITVVRGYSTDQGGIPGTAVTLGAGVNPNIHVIGTTFEENSDAPTGVSFDPIKRTNFTQIFRDTFDASRTAINTRLRTGDQVREAKRETLQDHSAAIEKSLWFGQADDTQLINGNIARTTGGVFAYIPAANIVTAGATSTWANILGWLEQAFRFGSQEKMGFCGNAAMLTIQEAVRLSTNASVNISQGQQEFGMNVTRLTSPFGTVVLKTHPLFNQITSGTDFDSLDSWLAIVDMDELVYRFLRNGDTQFESNLQANGLDGMKSGYLTECGLEIHHGTTHFLIKELNGAAAG